MKNEYCSLRSIHLIKSEKRDEMTQVEREDQGRANEHKTTE